MTGPPSNRQPAVKDRAEQQSFHSLVRLLSEAHDREVSALQAKIAELQRGAAAGHGGDGRQLADTAEHADGGRGATAMQADRGTRQLAAPTLAPQGRPFSPALSRSMSNFSTGQMNLTGSRTSRHDTHELDPHLNPVRLALAETPRTPAPQADTPEGMRCCRRAAVRAHRLVRWPGFDIFVGVVIFLNAICIGAELEYSTQGEDTPMLQTFEYVFLFLYTLELALRGLADGVKCFRDNWVKADAVLLVVGLGSEVLEAVGVDGLGPIIIMRSLRLMRFLRAVRMVGRWKTLWKMVSGVMGSAETLASTFITLVFAVYIFTCFSLEIVSISSPRLKSDPKANEVVNKYFTNFQETAMTAIQFLTMDDAQDIYRPLVKVSPGFAVFFAVVFVIFPILLMNLVTATLVEHAISNSSMDESMKREEIKRKVRELVPRVKNAFRELEDGSGQVHMQDLATANFASMPGLDGVSQILTPQVLVDLWYFFDADDSGFISEEEFVNGVLQLALSETSFEITEVKHLVLANAKNVRALRQAVDRVLMAVTPTPTPGSSATTALPSARSLRTTG